MLEHTASKGTEPPTQASLPRDPQAPSMEEGGEETPPQQGGFRWPGKTSHHLKVLQIITTPQEEVKSTIMAHVRSRFKTVGGKAGFNFDIDTDNSIGATYTIQNPMARTFDWKGTEIVWLNGQEAGTLDKNSISYISSRPSHNLDAYYAGKSGKLSVNFNGTLYWNSRNREDDMNETSSELDSRRVLTKSANRNQLQAAKLVMGHPIAKGQLTFGSEASHTKIHNIYISDYETN